MSMSNEPSKASSDLPSPQEIEILEGDSSREILKVDPLSAFEGVGEGPDPSRLRQRIRRVGKRLHRRMAGDRELVEISRLVDFLENYVRGYAERVADLAAPKKAGRPKNFSEMSKPELLYVARSLYGATLSIKDSQGKLAATVERLAAGHGKTKDELALRAELDSHFDFQAPTDWDMDRLKAEWAHQEQRMKDAGKTIKRPVLSTIEDQNAAAVAPGALVERSMTDYLKEPTGVYRAFYDDGTTEIRKTLEELPGFAGRPGVKQSQTELIASIKSKMGGTGGPARGHGGEILAPKPEVD